MFHFSSSDFSIEVNINCIFLILQFMLNFVYQLIQEKNYLKKRKV